MYEYCWERELAHHLARLVREYRLPEAGSFAACAMWSLIAAFRAPDDGSLFDDPRIARIAHIRGLVESESASESPESSVEDNTANTLNDSLEGEFDVAVSAD